eukprot:3542529-Prymnesium_polylepis.1
MYARWNPTSAALFGTLWLSDATSSVPLLRLALGGTADAPCVCSEPWRGRPRPQPARLRPPKAARVRRVEGHSRAHA